MNGHGWITVTLALGALVLMSSGRLAPHLVMAAVLVILSASGILDAESALAGFSNGGMITVAAMFVVAAGIHHSGGVDVLVQGLLKTPRSARGALARIAIPVAAVSGFLNNTPVVATLIPAVHAWSRRIRIAPSRLMLPLSYAAIFGGTLTLIGTSTNLVVNGLYQQLTGESGFGLFSITWVGVPVALTGLSIMILLFPRILPDREDEKKFGAWREYTVEVSVAPDGPLAGKTVDDAGLRSLDKLYLVEIVRDDSVVAAVSSEESLKSGDRLVFAGDTQAVSDLLRINGIVPSSHDDEPGLSISRAERCLVEAVLSPESEVRGMTIRNARFRDRFGAVVVAVARGGQRVTGNLGNIRLQPGDVLLLEARPAFVSRQHYVKDFLLINDLGIESPRHDKAGLAWGILALLVSSAALGMVSMLNAALVGAMLMLLTGCCSISQARHGMNVPVLMTIACSFALGTALETTGAARFTGEQIIAHAGNNALLMIALTYMAVSLLTELITNNAAAVVMLPIVISLANAAGLDAEPFVITIMMAASASFATPLGYQTNMMVYGPGNYRFSDFLKVGIPMNIIIGIVSVAVIYVRYFLISEIS